MFGKTETHQLFLCVVIAVSAIAVACDLARGRIYNWLTLPVFLAGLAASAFYAGWSGLLGALLGALVALVIYGPMFAFGIMGGGDVKLLIALGAWGGLTYAAQTALLGVLLGGVMAAAILLARGRAVSFFRRISVSLFARMAPELDRKSTMPFGVPIAVAAVWIAVADPFTQWGIRLW